MNKVIEKIFLGFMFVLVLYNLFYYDIIEGNRRRRRRRRQMMAKKKQMMAKKKQMMEIKRRQLMASKNKPSARGRTRFRGNNPRFKQDIVNLKKKIKQNKHNNSNLYRLFNKGQQLVSKNHMKINELKSFSKSQGDKLQGNIDLVSSDLANNNIENSKKITNLKDNLTSINDKMIKYEKNNANLEKMLKTVNLELKTKYQNKK